MSTENLNKFNQAIASNPELQAKLAQIQSDAARSVAEKMAGLSAEAGTPFTAEEFLASAQAQSSELSDQQLENVAGGGWDVSDGNILFSLMTFGVGCGFVASVSVMVTGKDADPCQPSKWGK